jgi:hypothetical protein
MMYNYIINRFRYIFKNDPCKTCLVQACCKHICDNKVKWNYHTDIGRSKKPFGVSILIATILSISMLLFGVIRLVIECFN